MLEMKMIPVDKIRPNPFQLREKFDKENIKELANSIDESGLLQPILVRKKGETYEIIAGERRWRAFQFAEMEKIPCVVKEADDHQAKELSLVENWHRLDLEMREAEVFVWSIWKEGKESGKYKSIRDMSEKLRIPHTTLNRLILAHKDREEIGTGATYRDYDRTRILKDEPELRKKVLEKRVSGGIEALDLEEFSKAMKEASEPVQEALLEEAVSPEEARAIDSQLETPNEKREVIEELKRGRSADLAESRIDLIKHRREKGEKLKESGLLPVMFGSVRCVTKNTI